MKKLKVIFLLFLILSATYLAFSPALKNNFINLDDNLYVTDNTAIRFFGSGSLKNISTSFFITHYQPATILSYLLEYQFFKLNPVNYHLDNLILHLLNCLLVFWVIYLLTGKIAVSGLTAILFGIHPLQVESVAWVSERKNLLYAFFFLASLVSYLYYLKKKRGGRYYFLCLGLFLLSILSKSMAMTLPPVLLLLDYFTSRKINRQALTEKIPFFILSLACGIVALLGSYLTAVPYEKGTYSLLTRFMGASCDIIFYLQKIILPLKLSASYPYFEINSSFAYYFYSFILVLILISAVAGSIRYSRKIIFGSMFFLLTVLPALRFFPLECIAVADRYVYVAIIGVFYLLAEGCAWLYRRQGRYYRLIRIFLILVLTLVIIFWSMLTWQRCQVWKDSLSLWNDVIAKYPANASAYNNRGVFFLNQGEYEKAHADFLMAVKIKAEHPDDPTFKYNFTYKYYYLNLAASLQALGRNKEAQELFEQLIRETQAYFKLYPLVSQQRLLSYNLQIEAEVYFNLANLEEKSGNRAQAIALYNRVLEIDPRFVYAHYNLGSLYLLQDKKEEAKAEFLQAIQIDPACTPAYIKLASLYQELGQDQELELLYKQAAAYHLEFFTAYYYLGNRYADLNQNRQALSLYRRAIKLNPSSKEAYLGLGNACLSLGKTKSAIIYFKQALSLDPNLAVAHNNLALAYYYAKDYELAIRHCDRAVALGYKVSPKFLTMLKSVNQ